MTLCPVDLVEGLRVDCLFDDEYFRGTVGSPTDGQCLVRFDDGDVRDNVPPEDIAVPLCAGCRVECLFEVRKEMHARV